MKICLLLVLLMPAITMAQKPTKGPKPTQPPNQELVMNIDTVKYQLKINYFKSIPGMTASAHYEWLCPLINESNFPIPTNKVGIKDSVVAKLFPFKNDISDNTKIILMAKAGYRPATIFELFAFGPLPKELQNQIIIALGSDCYDFKNRVANPYLVKDSRGMGIDIGYTGQDWPRTNYYYYLAIKI